MKHALLRILITVTCILFVTPLCLYATTYYFSMAGDDSNKGTSVSLPKKTLHAAIALAMEGNTLLFKRGEAWYSPFKAFDLRNKSGSERNKIIIDAYGEGQKPVIAGLDLLDKGGWMNVAGTQLWRHEVRGYSSAHRLFLNGVSKYKVNTSKLTADEADADQPYEWYLKETSPNESGIVYVNSGSQVSPPAIVEVLPAGVPSTILMENTNYVTIRNIDIRGGSTGNVVHIESPSSHILFDSCIVQRANGSGILAENSATGDLSTFVADLSIINCVLDKVWSDYENDPALTLTGDGIFLRHAVERGLMKGNKILNWGHSGISITSYSLGAHGVHHIIVEQNDISAGESGYMHAIDMNGFHGLTTHNIIRRNYFHDYLVTGHILGSFNQIYSNIFAGIKITKMPRHSHQGWAVDWSPWPYRGNGPWIEAHDNYLINNTFSDAEEFLIMVADNNNNPDPVSNNVIANNILYGFGRLALNAANTVRGSLYVRNNNFWNFDASAPVARYKTAGMGENCTAAQLNILHPDYCSDNVQADPLFADMNGRNFRLTPGSPLKLRSGGTNLFNQLLGPGFVDYYGKKFDRRHPSMGAIQYKRQNVRTIVVL